MSDEMEIPEGDDDEDEEEGQHRSHRERRKRMAGDTMSERSEVEEAAATYAWEYFKYHAQQRQAVFRFYLVIVGGLFAGYLLTLHDKPEETNDIRSLILTMLVVVSFLFWRLDHRSHQLVKIAEDYLEQDEQKLSNALGEKPDDARIRIIHKSNANKDKAWPFSWFSSFRRVYAWIFGLVGLMAIGFHPWARAAVECVLAALRHP